jgi:hypothetical protein
LASKHTTTAPRFCILCATTSKPASLWTDEIATSLFATTRSFDRSC